MQADKEFRKALSAILNQLQKEGKALTRIQKKYDKHAQEIDKKC